MKRAKNIIYAGVALLLVSACNNSVNDQDDRNLDTREEIQLSTQVLNTQVQPLSRATFTSGQTFHVVMTDNNSTFADQYSIATPGAVTSGKNALSLAPKKYWDDLGGITSDIKMFGVYPQFKQNGSTSTISSSDANSVISWTITADTSKSDLMSAVIPSYEYADRSTAAELTFNHVLSKVSIRVFSGNGGPDVSGATVTYHLPASGTYDYRATTTPYGTATAANITAIQPSQANGSHTMLSFPLNYTGDYKIATISIGENNYPVMVNNPAFAAGSHYVYKVTINNSDITVTGKMVDWDEVTPVEVSKKLITVADVNIEDVQNVSITNGSKLIVSLTENGESTPISTDMVFTYNSTDQKWVVTPNTELYWDDLKLPLAKAEALLKINNTNNAEDLFYASKTEGLTINTSSSTAQSISFGETFVRPLAKMTFKIISDYTQVTGATAQDQITLSKLDNSGASVVIPDSKIHVVNGTKVTESTGSSLVNAVKSSESTATEYIYTAYIMPKTNSTTLCEITIPESGFANVYTPRLSTAINFVAGKHYTYTINITKSGISFTGKLVDWDPVNGGDIISTL